ncbi:Wadjet anti-phage system protein JetA family protein [Endozoicomonas sp. ONNA1]|uniref:Wadjet anti-phage system protein JetA family protein n=1 Tax=Endozoicomonas sp. ONNA1 TaxID=2828740 RepID=UPI0021476139|nr:Wadjet anti-phage system protein JetA family protein [Endozoicomonas sp. ONNA1]
MIFDGLSPDLFRPLASKNARLYYASLQALYRRLIDNQIAGDECTPKEAKQAIRLGIIADCDSQEWAEETDDEDAPEPDVANRIYRKLRETGWLLEIDDVGYRKITSFAYLPAQLLTVIAQISRSHELEIGSTCQGVYTNLFALLNQPRESGPVLSFSAKSSRHFYGEVATLSATTRELSHRMMNQQAGPELFRTFFREFVDQVISRDYKTLNSKDNPYQYRSKILSIVTELKTSPDRVQLISEGIKATQPNEDLETIIKRVHKELDEIFRIFDNVPRLMDSIERYRRSMTRRTSEAIRYAYTVTGDIGKKLDSVASKIAGTAVEDDLLYPVKTTEDTYLSKGRLYTPKTARAEAQSTRVQHQQPPLDKIALDRAVKAYHQRRSDNPKRLTQFLESQLGDKALITTDDITIEGLDDLLSYLDLRKLINDGASRGSAFSPLQQHYKVTVTEGAMTKNQYLTAPKLTIIRRSSKRNTEHAS